MEGNKIMALNDVANNQLVEAVYQADDLQFYIVRLKKYRADAGAFFYPVGGSGVPTPVGYLPSNIRMRTLHLVKNDVDLSGNPQPGGNRHFDLPVGAFSNWNNFDPSANTIALDGIVCSVVGKSPERLTFM